MSDDALHREIARLKVENDALRRHIAKMQANIDTLRAWIAAEASEHLARLRQEDRCDD